MTAYVEHLRATLTSEEFDDLCIRVLELTLATDRDSISRELPAIAEHMRAEGYSEEQIRHGITVFADQAGLDRNRGFN